MILQNKTIFITGASRGIGKAIALKLATEGANIVIASKSVEEDPRLGGTIFSAAEEVEKAGGKALPIQLDIRNEEASKEAIEKAVNHFGGLDALVNNASAINLMPTLQTSPKRYDLMHNINVRGTFFLSQAAIPHLAKSPNAHILSLSPPVNLNSKWLSGHIAYTLSKYNMTLMMLGFAAELKEKGIAANSLWPKTTIATAAVNNLLGGEMLMNMSRTPQIVADAAFCILQQPAAACTGNAFIDEEVLKTHGITDFTAYAYVPGNTNFYPDLFVDP
jgi:citronellol/citronellal dehydrogenase